MVDSYLAPIDLRSARARVDATARARCRHLGFGSPDVVPHRSGVDVGPIVVLETGSASAQLSRISEATAAVIADRVLWNWDDGSLRLLSQALAPGASLVFVEPTADLGWRRVVHYLSRFAVRLWFGHHFESDIPARLRAAGLTVTTTDRFTTGPLGLRSYVWGEAEHIVAD